LIGDIDFIPDSNIYIFITTSVVGVVLSPIKYCMQTTIKFVHQF